MKKAILLSVIICLVLTACNLPAAGQNPTQPPEGNAVATQVGALLTAQPTRTISPTRTNQPTTIPLPPTPTAIATITPNLVTPTSITATISPEDPRSSLGEPIWKNTFDNGRGFALETPYEDDNTRIAVEGGKLVLSGLKANGWHTWRLTAPKVQDFYLEASVHTRTCAGSDLYGLVARAPDFDSGQGYYFGVTCDGRFNFGKWQDQGINSLISLTAHPAILSGSNQTNRLGMMFNGSQITLYANGRRLQDIDDSTFVNGGYFGAWLAASQTAGFTVEIDEMAYWNLR